MLPDALEFERYGSVDDMHFVIGQALSDTESRSIDTIHRFCEERSTALALRLPAILALLEYIAIVRKDEGGNFILIEHSEPVTATFIAKRIFSGIAKDMLLSSFMPPEAIEYDSLNDVICVRNNFIPLEYSGLKNLLVSIGFFKPHPLSGNLLQIEKKFEEYFEADLIPGIKQERFPEERLRGLSLSALMRIQELNEMHGREAEAFVLEYERKRLGGAAAARVRIISDLQCDAGYDIVSFSTPEAAYPDKFIEVKSYTGEQTFFWSRNEVAVSKAKSGNYFLYLVNREKMARQGYAPQMIQDPYRKIFCDEKCWGRDEMSWHFYRK